MSADIVEAQARYLWVGLAVIFAAGCLTVFVLWLADTGGEGKNKFYTIYFRQHSLEGLQVDSGVTLKGLSVGNVHDFSISPKDIEEAKVAIRVEDGTPIKTDTQAVIRRNLLTGLAWIDLINSSQGSKNLAEILQDEKYPVIQEGRTELGALQESLPAVLDDVGDTIHQARAFFSDENRVALTNTLANIEKFTTVLAKNDKHLDEMIVNISVATKDLREMSHHVGNLAKNADTQVAEVSAELIDTLHQMKLTAQTLEQRVAEISAALNNTAQVLTLETSNVAQDLSVAAQSLSRTLERYDNPKALILGPNERSLGPGEVGGK